MWIEGEMDYSDSIICIYAKISLTELVNGLVLLMLPIYFNALERTTVLGITGYL